MYVQTHIDVSFDQIWFKNLDLEFSYFILPYEVTEDKRRKGGSIGTSGRTEFQTETGSY